MIPKLAAKKEYSINFAEHQNKFFLICITMGWIDIFLNGVEIYKFKAKDSKINCEIY